MKSIDTREMSLAEVQQALVRPEVDEVAVAPAVEQGIQRIFGEALNPSQVVERIVRDVASQGNAALFDYSQRIDGVELNADNLFVSPEEIDTAVRACDNQVMQAIRTAAEQIRTFHEAQLRQTFLVTGAGNSLLGQRIVPLERVGCYVPGGRAPLVSSALMCIVPAKVAGVEEIIVATPAGRDGKVHQALLAAISVAGATRVLRAGGAQAVAALAYGTENVPRVDKIVGPGNIFVSLAKKQVFGRVGIDSLAGPSEIVVIADAKAQPELVAADLLSQAEHDTEAAAILLTPSAEVLEAVLAEVEKQAAALPRQEVIQESLSRWGRAVLCRDLPEAIQLSNLIAPEHLEIMTEDAWRWLPQIKHAGAVFLGSFSPEPIGDYVAGPNHILPTNGTARFSSPLGVDDFVRRSSVIAFSADGIAQIGAAAVKIGEAEGLHAHAQAVRLRLDEVNKESGGDKGGSN